MKKLKLTLMKLWCVLMHRKNHDNYWTEFAAKFYRCGKCGVHHAKREVVLAIALMAFTATAAVQHKGAQLIVPDNAPTFEKLRTAFQSTNGVPKKWQKYPWSWNEVQNIRPEFTTRNEPGKQPPLSLGLLRATPIKGPSEWTNEMWGVYHFNPKTGQRLCVPMIPRYLTTNAAPPRPHAIAPPHSVKPRTVKELAAAGHPLSEVQAFETLPNGDVAIHHYRFGDAVTNQSGAITGWSPTNVTVMRNGKAIATRVGAFMPRE